METASHVTLEGLRTAFGERVVHDGLSCSFGRGEITVILGGSGSGKSTLLRVVAGLVEPEEGTVLVDGEDVAHASERHMRTIRRKVGMMFQGGALLDSMTVFENLALPLREHSDLDAAAIAQRVRERLAAVGVEDAEDLLPGQLSGGMRKRVALARAIVEEPEILLCDEPFSGLDPISTKRIEALLVGINAEHGMTTIVVSHHIPSTMRMAHRVLCLLPDGAVSGTPAELARSTDPRVMSFLNEDVDDAVLEAGVEIEVRPV